MLPGQDKMSHIRTYYLTTTEYQLISIFVIMYHNYDTPSHFIVTYFPDAGTPMMQKIYFLSRGNIAWA
jgi:hypothetical protein